MKTIKMTTTDKAADLLAGLIYKVSDKKAEKYLALEMAVEIEKEGDNGDG